MFYILTLHCIKLADYDHPTEESRREKISSVARLSSMKCANMSKKHNICFFLCNLYVSQYFVTLCAWCQLCSGLLTVIYCTSQ